MSDLCIHDLEPSSCTICLHGPSRRGDDSTAECRSCHAEILWVVTEKGKQMPLDIDSSDDGMFVKVRLEADGSKLVHFVKTSERDAETRPLYTSHFVTCPDRDEHRRG